VRRLRLAELETPELLAVKSGRSRAEYCWTLTPFAPRFVFESDPTVSRVTYVDADLWFLSKPAPLFAELDAGGRSVLVTEHAYAKGYDRSRESGRFCVQFLSFVRERSEAVRAWWEARCVEWCFARHEEGRFGDQMYLDHWPTLFPDEVQVLQRREATLAPWNMTAFPASEGVFFHFHGLRILRNAQVLLASGYPLPATYRRSVYAPYLADLSRALDDLGRAGWIAPPQHPDVAWKHGFRNVLRALRYGRRPLTAVARLARG
jgi:hypothetical protein